MYESLKWSIATIYGIWWKCHDSGKTVERIINANKSSLFAVLVRKKNKVDATKTVKFVVFTFSISPVFSLVRTVWITSMCDWMCANIRIHNLHYNSNRNFYGRSFSQTMQFDLWNNQPFRWRKFGFNRRYFFLTQFPNADWAFEQVSNANSPTTQNAYRFGVTMKRITNGKLASSQDFIIFGNRIACISL